MATTANVEGLLDWFRDPSNKSFWNEDLLDIRTASVGGGAGVFAREDIDVHSHDHCGGHGDDHEHEDTPILLRVSKEAILSGRNSKICNLLYEGGLDGMQAVVLAYLYEKADPTSPWKGYVDSINIYDDNGKPIVPPCMWDEEAKKCLKGTEAEVLGVTDPEEIERYFTIALAFAREVESVIPRPKELDIVGKPQEEVEKMFEVYAAIVLAVSSRAFTIDDFHGLALVPGADLFNHNAYDDEDVHFETIADVCPFCGKDSGCGHSEFGGPDSEEDDSMTGSDSEDEEESGEEEENDDEQLLEITEEVIERFESDLLEQNGSESDESSDESDAELSPVERERNSAFSDPDSCCDITLVKSIKKDQEIFNTYGDLSNPFLLSSYLFVAKNNPNDTVGLGRQIIRFSKNSKFAKHISWWEKTGYVLFKSQFARARGLDEDEEQQDSVSDGWKLDMKIAADGNPTPATYAFARLLSLSHIHLKRVILQKHKLHSSLTIRDPRANRLLLHWCQQRVSQYGEVKVPPGYKHMVSPLINHEKQILAKAIERLSR
ncbi:unnamed protein product [Kuraishia capsulata CBS 1993]|uniref:SET domain-containing protein n=1 Tax=Kuraishia capsulata CBS 1993 TaxID=1382522 RepID=W6MMF7_9ASCO|nr:uncharacterized protein KUCA_T00003710001 [Kuraishia capsulata CBS 1993]CDK27731.1 unnamed protein product [Kuraishia capsulata CBS 1993]